MEIKTPYRVIFTYGFNHGHRSFADLESAKHFIDHNSGNGYYILGLYDLNTRRFLPDGLDDDGLRRHLRSDYVSEHFPLESDVARLKKQQTQAVSAVKKSYIVYTAVIALTILFSVSVNVYCGIRIPSNIGTALATVCYGGGTLGYLVTWHIQTWSGKTKSELLNTRLLILSYILGTTFTILGLTF